MKKYIFFLLLLMVSLTLTPFSYGVNASSNESLTIQTYYPEDVLDYADLTNIKIFSISDNNIAYTLDGNNLIIFDITNKSSKTITDFVNIQLIKYVNDKILVVDNNKIYVIDDYTKSSTTELIVLKDNLPNFKAIDIYSTKSKIFIGFVYNTTFELLEYSKLTENASPDNTKTFVSSYYTNAYMMAINNNKAYIVYYTTPPSQNGVCVQSYLEDTPTVKDTFVVYAQLIDTFYHNGNEYIVTFTNELLLLLDNNFETLHDIKIGTDIDIENNIFPILSISHFDYHNNTLYVSDTHYKTIQSFLINEENSEISLKSDNILLCGNNQAKGRFNNVDNIFIQGNTIFTADTDNNRIQILTHSKSSIVKMPTGYTSPISICRDSNNVIYIVANSSDGDRILKYQYVNDNYKLTKTITPAKSNCKISSITVFNDVVYALDYYNNEIIYVNGETTSYKCKFSDTTNTIRDVKENSKITYIQKLNRFVILNDDVISLHNASGVMIDEITFTNCKDITIGLSEIYTLSDSNVTLINIEDDQLNISSNKVSDESLSQFTTITYDIINKQIFAFNSIRSCIEYFDCNLANNPFNFENFADDNFTTINTIPYIYELTYDPLIYSHPYNLGDYCNTDFSIENGIAVGYYDNYIRLIFNLNDELKEGYVPIERCTKLDFTYSVTNVITVNQFVPIYKYPTLLTFNDSPITCGTLPIYTKVTLTHTCPATIDGKTFYMYQANGNVGFLYSQDIILDSSKSISNLNTENASVNLIDKEEVKLLAENKTTAIYTLKDGTRIYVEEYDKHSEYTKVIYKDSNLKTYEGFIETKYIVMDKLDLSKIILISLITFSIVILIIITVVYISIKKKK